MSYGDEVTLVDFSQTPFLCLSGENGHGKSALLDAITWSLWGVSRAGKKNHDDLIRIGADEMSVQFTFSMDELFYRVLRKRSKRAAASHWELQQHVEDEEWRSLTGASSGDTERTILSLLRMSYETFLNSAYLRQGQADLFVQQTPSKRKEILSEILDLSRYDQLEASARTIARESEFESRDLQQEVSLIDSELLKEPEYLTAFELAEKGLSKSQAALTELRKQSDLLVHQQAEIADKNRQRLVIQGRIESGNRELARLNLETQEHAANIAKSNAILEQKADLERQLAQRDVLREELSLADTAVLELRDIRTEHSTLERMWQSKKNALEMDLQRLKSSIDQASRDIVRLDVLVEEGAKIKAGLTRLNDAQTERSRLEQDLQALKGRETVLMAEFGRIKASIADWEIRIAELDRQEGNCTVCDTPLTPERIAVVGSEYRARLGNLRNEKQSVASEGSSVHEKVKLAGDHLQAVHKEHALLEASQSRLTQIELETHSLASMRAGQIKMSQEAAQLQRSLHDNSFAKAESDRLKELSVKMQELEPLEKRRSEIVTELKAHNDLDKNFASLTVAVQTTQREEELKLRVLNSIEEKETELKRLSLELDSIQDVSQEAAQLAYRSGDLQQQEREERKNLESSSREVGKYQELIEHCSRRKSIRVNKQSALTESSRRYEVHNQLALAFGKKGVQALIIENAIPELQDEANRLLGRLSDGDLSVSLETQRASKSKKDSSIETLDIKVSDSLGTRPLEMYSGGEGFRVAFALRLALSRLLTRRAGARLETLIIDEGFGTQDGKGREKLVDVLTAIRDEFEKVIVITHIDELKDAFPARLEVVKTPSGSQVTLLEGVGA